MLNVMIVVHDYDSVFVMMVRLLSMIIPVAFVMIVMILTFAVPVVVRMSSCCGDHEKSGNRSYQQQGQKQSLLHFVLLTNPKSGTKFKIQKCCLLTGCAVPMVVWVNL